MLKNDKGLTIYHIISIIGLLALIFVLALPQMFNVNKKTNEDLCIRQMEQVYIAIKQYMLDRKVDFTGDAVELKRTGYLKSTFECPEESVGDKYIMSGKYNDGALVIVVKCPNVEKYPGHVIPQSFIDRNK